MSGNLEPDGIELHVEDGIGYLTFANEERHNSLSPAMTDALPRALATLDRDGDVRVIALRGAGDRAFVSGADIRELAEPGEDAAYGASLLHAFAAIGSAEKPVVALIRGFCLGGGLTVALRADLRLASDRSSFGIPAARLGVGYPFAEVERLVAVAGPAVAADILLTARRLSVEEALRCGLVQDVFPDTEFAARADERLRAIAAGAPLTLRAAKASIREAQRCPSKRDLDALQRLIDRCWASEDYAEGRAAFAERRVPRFRGR